VSGALLQNEPGFENCGSDLAGPANASWLASSPVRVCTVNYEEAALCSQFPHVST